MQVELVAADRLVWSGEASAPLRALADLLPKLPAKRHISG